MSSRDTKIKRTQLESGLELLAKEYERNTSYGHTYMHDNMVPWTLRELGTKCRVTQHDGMVPWALWAKGLYEVKGDTSWYITRRQKKTLKGGHFMT